MSVSFICLQTHRLATIFSSTDKRFDHFLAQFSNTRCGEVSSAGGELRVVENPTRHSRSNDSHDTQQCQLFVSFQTLENIFGNGNGNEILNGPPLGFLLSFSKVSKTLILATDDFEVSWRSL